VRRLCAGAESPSSGPKKRHNRKLEDLLASRPAVAIANPAHGSLWNRRQAGPRDMRCSEKVRYADRRLDVRGEWSATPWNTPRAAMPESGDTRSGSCSRPSGGRRVARQGDAHSPDPQALGELVRSGIAALGVILKGLRTLSRTQYFDCKLTPKIGLLDGPCGWRDSEYGEREEP